MHLTELQPTADKEMPGILQKDRVAYLELPLNLNTEVKSSCVFVRAAEGGLEEEQARLQMLL